jgi:hypothetical protein
MSSPAIVFSSLEALAEELFAPQPVNRILARARQRIFFFIIDISFPLTKKNSEEQQGVLSEAGLEIYQDA